MERGTERYFGVKQLTGRHFGNESSSISAARIILLYTWLSFVITVYSSVSALDVSTLKTGQAMPPVAQKASGSHARYIDPPNPNRGTDTDAHITRESISHQPSPAIVTTTSHVGKHVLPRRFLGPMPEQVVNSDEAVEKRRRFANMRTAALRRIRRTDEDGLGGQGGFGDQGGRRESLGRVVRKIRVRRRNKHGEDVDEDVDLEDAEDSDSEEFEGERHRFGRKKKKKRKHVWIGESFDVGREFLSAPKSAKNDTAAPDGFVDQSVSDTAVQPERPSNPSRSTLETFVTARTEMSVSATTSKSSLSFQDPVENGYHLNIDNTPSPLANPSLAPQDNPVRNSQTSSMQPLIASSPQKGEGPKFSKGKHILPDTVSSSGHPTPSELKKRLKSAIRKSPAGPSRPAASAIHSVSKGGGIDGNKVRAKTVHFPVGSPRDFSQALSYNNEQPRKGNKAPADPEAVLARGGSDAAGTSAGAADEAIIHDSSEEDEEDVLPGEVIMRGECMRLDVAETHLSRSDAGPDWAPSRGEHPRL